MLSYISPTPKTLFLIFGQKQWRFRVFWIPAWVPVTGYDMEERILLRLARKWTNTKLKGKLVHFFFFLILFDMCLIWVRHEKSSCDVVEKNLSWGWSELRSVCALTHSRGSYLAPSSLMAFPHTEIIVVCSAGCGEGEITWSLSVCHCTQYTENAPKLFFVLAERPGSTLCLPSAWFCLIMPHDLVSSIPS